VISSDRAKETTAMKVEQRLPIGVQRFWKLV